MGQSNADTGQTSAGLCGRNRDFQHLGGPKTAIRAGVFTWAVGVFLSNLSNYPLGLFSTRLLVITSIVALVEIVVATLVGAWLYKEEEKLVAQAVHRAAV